MENQNPVQPNPVPPVVPSQPPTPPTNDHPLPIPSEPLSTDPSSKPKWLLLVGIVLIFLLLITGGAYFLAKNSASKKIAAVPTIAPTPTPTPNPTANWKMFSSNCEFNFKYPDNLIASRSSQVADPENQCATIYDKNIKVGFESIQGFYLTTSRTKLGTIGFKDAQSELDINSLDDYVKWQGDVATSKNTKIGGLIGKEFSSKDKAFKFFIFLKNNYVYDFIWNSYVKDETASNIISTANFINSDETADWKTYSGSYFSFKYPPEWTPTKNVLCCGAMLEEVKLGIPGVASDQTIGYSSIDYGDIKVDDAIRSSSWNIGEIAGLKWVRKGEGYISYDYYKSIYPTKGSFGAHVTVSSENKSLENQLDLLTNSVKTIR